MHVLNVLDYSPPFGGSLVRNLAALGDRMASRGDRLYLAFARHRPWLEDLRGIAGILVVPQIERPLRAGFPRELQRLGHELRVDVVHCHFSFALPLSLAVTGARCPGRFIYHWHNPPKPLLRPERVGARRLVYDRLARMSDRRVISHHIAPSREIGDLLLRAGWASPAKLTVITNGVPIPDVAPPKPRAPGGRFVIGMVASFRPQKDHETLLRAFSRIIPENPTVDLWLVGDGPARPRAERLASTLGLAGRVRFVGSVPDPGSLYRELDAFVLATNYEGYPYALLEAMSHGLPVISSRLACIEEIVRDGENGLLAEAGCAESLAGQLLRIVGDAALGKRLGDAARAEVVTCHSADRWAENVAGLYERCGQGQEAP